VAALALSSGVIAEAVVSRWMARHAVAAMLSGAFNNGDEPLTQRAIVKFYTPLALTSMIAMITAPVLTFFMGRGRLPVESLAVLPVVNNLVFMFRSGGVAFQDVSVALSGRHHEHQREVGRAAFVLGSATTAALALLLFTPLASVWFRGVAGLPPELYGYAVNAAQIIAVLPAIEYFLSFQRSQFIINRQTTVITMSMAIEVALIGAMLLLCIATFGMIGAIAASCSIVTGRVASSAFLYASSRFKVISRRSQLGAQRDEPVVLPTPPEPES
jgi:O-antigen/teichoic acid export membrane protein